MKVLGTTVGTYMNLDWLCVLILFPVFPEKIYLLRSNSGQDCTWFSLYYLLSLGGPWTYHVVSSIYLYVDTFQHLLAYVAPMWHALVPYAMLLTLRLQNRYAMRESDYKYTNSLHQLLWGAPVPLCTFHCHWACSICHVLILILGIPTPLASWFMNHLTAIHRASPDLMHIATGRSMDLQCIT